MSFLEKAATIPPPLSLVEEVEDLVIDMHRFVLDAGEKR
jgi:hypothetical protein